VLFVRARSPVTSGRGYNRPPGGVKLELDFLVCFVDVSQLGHPHNKNRSATREEMEKTLLQAQGEPAWSSHDRLNNRSRGMTPPSRGSGAGTPPGALASAFVPHLTEKYDPDHPDADWGGFVQRTYKKRVFTDPAATRNVRLYSMLQPRASSDGSVSSLVLESRIRRAWWPRSKQLAGHSEHIERQEDICLEPDSRRRRGNRMSIL